MFQIGSFILLSHLALAGIPDTFTLNVVYGDNKTLFILSNTSAGAILEYQSSVQNSKKMKVSPKNYRFVSAQVSAALKLEDEKQICSRNFIELIGKLNGQQVKKIGCIGSKTPISRKLTDLANTLDIQVF